MTSKTNHAAEMSDTDIRAVQQEQEFNVTSQDILYEVQLQHPVAFDNLNMCYMHKKGNMKTLGIAMLKTVCKYFGVSTEGFHERHKAEYLFALRELVKGCGCCPV